MPYITEPSELSKLLKENPVPTAETAKLGLVRPTDHFKIVTEDNPDMVRTLERQEEYVESELLKITVSMTHEEREAKKTELRSAFQNSLSIKAFEEQQSLISQMRKHGIPVLTILEDKVTLEKEWDYYTDQIFATDTGQYFDRDGELLFIPAHFKNKQRKGEERLAKEQADGLGAKIQTLYSKEGEGTKLLFEGGDIRQMPGKKLFFIGQGHRSDPATSEAIADISGYYVLPIKLLQEQFYHLDCCFLPLPNDAAVIYEGEYELDDSGNYITDKETGWPRLKSGTETMTPTSRALIRGIYGPEKLILISKAEALAFATNAAVLESQGEGHRFKMFVNGDRSSEITDEATAISEHRISYTSKHIAEIMEATGGTMDIIEVPFSTMHGSGGSVRCTVQEVACAVDVLSPHKRNPYHFSAAADRLETRMQVRELRRHSLFSDRAAESPVVAGAGAPPSPPSSPVSI